MVASQSFNAATGFDLPKLPESGTYTIILAPGASYALDAALTLSQDVTGALIAGGEAQTFSTTRVGHNARYSFDAAAGSTFTLLFSGNEFPGSTNIYIYQPNSGATPWRSYVLNGSGGTYDLANLPATGIYTVLVSPTGEATGTLQISLSLKNLVLGTPTVNSVEVNQNGSYRLSVSYTVTNTGPSPAKASWYDRGYLSVDGSYETSDPTIGSRYQTTDLAPGASYTAEVVYTTSTAVVPGPYTLFVWSDAYKNVGESDETDNLLGVSVNLP